LSPMAKVVPNFSTFGGAQRACLRTCGIGHESEASRPSNK
jgi:hypothetical protein